MKSIKTKIKHTPAIITIIIAALLLSAGVLFGSEGHEGQPASEFHADRAHVRVSLSPETWVKGKKTGVSVMVTDHVSGAALLDAELYVLFEKAGEASSPSGHGGGAHSGAVQAQNRGLDFGDMPDAAPVTDLSRYSRLVPQDKAGVYGAEYRFDTEGDYIFTLAIKSMGGKRFAEPFLVGGKLSYREASKAPRNRMLAVMGTLLLSGLAALGIMALRKAVRVPAGEKINLLDIPPVKRFMQSSWFPTVFQLPVLIVFLIIIAAGLFGIQRGDRNIATLLMWTLWWAAIIFTFVFVGRVWCMMCPFGAIQDWLGRLFSIGKSFPRPLRNIWLPTFLFFGLTWWDSFSGIVNKPALTAYLLIGFFSVAAVMSLVFKGRTFCRYICPIGGLVGLYSMFSPVELRSKCRETCRKHRVKECLQGNEAGRPCPMFEPPLVLDRNNYCNFCGECVKSCSQDTITLRFRSFAQDLWASAKGRADEAYLAMMLVGVSIVVTGEMVEPWHTWMDAVGKLIPFDAWGVTAHAAREKATFLAVMSVGSLIVPLLLLTLAGLAVKKTVGRETPFRLGDTVVQFAYMFIPVGLSMHLAHNVSHLLREGPGIIPAVRRMFAGYTGGSTANPEWKVTPLMGTESVFWLQMLILTVLAGFSLYAGYRIAERYYGNRALRAFIPMAALAVFFMLINIFILGQPMALRHTH
ncbi:MAG: 4Fe-4S binding protein [Thermodesulfovibrionales bacterium]